MDHPKDHSLFGLGLPGYGYDGDSFPQFYSNDLSLTSFDTLD